MNGQSEQLEEGEREAEWVTGETDTEGDVEMGSRLQEACLIGNSFLTIVWLRLIVPCPVNIVEALIIVVAIVQHCNMPRLSTKGNAQLVADCHGRMEKREGLLVKYGANH